MMERRSMLSCAMPFDRLSCRSFLVVGRLVIDPSCGIGGLMDAGGRTDLKIRLSPSGRNALRAQGQAA